MKRTPLILSLLGIAGATGAWMLRKNYARNFEQDVAQLFSLAQSASPQNFAYDQLAGLPDPVQRYFRRVLPEGHPSIRTVRLKHSGRFKTSVNTDWTDIVGEQYFTTDPPGFIWRGKTQLFTARDQYVAGRGRLVVRLFSLVPIVNVRGKTVDEGELLRWLGESVWFPTNLLPSERLRWSSVDDHTATLTFRHEGLTLNYTVSFNEQDELVRLETQRYLSPDQRETWVGELSNYRRINNVLIPTRARATWELPEGNHTYADFWVSTVTYG